MAAQLYRPASVAFDSSGNLYIADQLNNRIRKVAAGTSVITTIAGSGTNGYSGDGGLAINAALNYPVGVLPDSAGNIYLADTYNHRVRRINASTGIISTVAGNGSSSYSGDGASAVNAGLSYPQGMAMDNAGNLYIADSNNNRVRKVNVATGNISSVAGTGSAGYSGDGGLATNAALSGPIQIAVDSFGNLFIADYNNHSVRKVDFSSGIITTVAGTGTSGFSGDGGAATGAQFNHTSGVAVDSSGNLFIGDMSNNRIRKVAAVTGIVSTVAGDGSQGYGGDGGEATSAKLYWPYGIALSQIGDLYIADLYNAAIRRPHRAGSRWSAIS